MDPFKLSCGRTESRRPIARRLAIAVVSSAGEGFDAAPRERDPGRCPPVHRLAAVGRGCRTNHGLIVVTRG